LYLFKNCVFRDSHSGKVLLGLPPLHLQLEFTVMISGNPDLRVLDMHADLEHGKRTHPIDGD
jgi:hypothetical protein